jgi:uncharacterized membrane protein YkvA (DUF1232 family)
MPARARLADTRLRRMFTTYRVRARTLMKDPAALDALASRARTQANGSTNSRIRDLSDQIKRLGRLVRAYADGSYRDVNAGSVVLAVAAILYFVSPIDLIPDAIPGAGLVDDATVIAFVLARLQLELDRFAMWERSQAITVE